MALLTRSQGFWLALAVVSLALAYLIVPVTSFPYLGVSLFLVFLTLVVLAVKPQLSWRLWLYALLSVVLALYIALRAHPLIVFADFAATLVFGSLLVLSYKRVKEPTSVIFSPVVALQKVLGAPPVVGWFSWVPKFGEKKSSSYLEIVGGLAVSVIVLVLIMPALASANPLFSRWMEALIPQLNDDFIRQILRLGVFAILLWFIPKTMKAGQTTVAESTRSTPIQVWWWLPKLLVVIVLAVFFASQYGLYSMDSPQLLAAGITHSQRTREIFGQLIWVAVITAGLMYLDLAPKRSRVLNLVLAGQAFALTLIALNSDLNYITAWGLTHMRIFGLVLLVWLWGIFALIIAAGYKQWVRTRIVEFAVIFSGFVLILVNAVNVDYLIAHLTTLKTHQGIDYVYISRLSPDARSYDDQIALLGHLTTSESPQDIKQALRLNLAMVHYLQDKYRNFDIREFNLSEYLAYREVKDIDPKPYDDLLQSR